MAVMFSASFICAFK